MQTRVSLQLLSTHKIEALCRFCFEDSFPKESVPMNVLKLNFWISVLCQGKLYLQLELSHCLYIRKKWKYPVI